MKEWKSTKQHMSLMNQKNRSISTRRIEDERKAKKAREEAAENRKKELLLLVCYWTGRNHKTLNCMVSTKLRTLTSGDFPLFLP